MNKEDKDISKIYRSILIKTSIFTFIISLIIWLMLSIVLNVFIHIKLLDYTESLFDNEIKGTQKLYDKTKDINLLDEYINVINQNKSYNLGLIVGKNNVIGNKSFDINIINELIKQKIVIGKNDTISQKIIKSKNYILNIYLNKNFIKYNKYSENIIFIIYKPFDIAHDYLFYIYFCNLIFILTGIILIIFLISLYLKKSYINPIKKLLKKSNLVKLGNLSINFNNDKRNDEIGVLTRAFKDNTDTLKDLIENVYKAVMIMTKFLNNLFKSSKSVSDSANAQVITVEENQGNFEKLNLMVKTITEESKRGSNYTLNAYEKTKIGLESIENLEKEMSKIDSSSQEITDIIRIINDIAEQTELLSLNASIESARAGESGRGFSVVAGEVRKLAEKTSNAANRVYGLITNNNNLIKAGVNYSKNASKILKEISMANELSASVAKIVNEETQKIKKITNEMMGVINYISEVAQANLLESEQVASTTNELSEQAIELQKFIEKFDIRSNDIKDNQKRIEKNLKNKLNEVNFYIKEKGNAFLPTGNYVDIKSDNKIFKVEELQLGEIKITNNNNYAFELQNKFDTHITIYQNFDGCLLSVATTLINYDNTPITGMTINPDSIIYKNIIKGNNYFTRIFWLDRWYIVAFKPFIDQTGFMQCAIAFGIPEEKEVKSESYKDNLVESNI